jgi:hypothetical protein
VKYICLILNLSSKQIRQEVWMRRRSFLLCVFYSEMTGVAAYPRRKQETSNQDRAWPELGSSSISKKQHQEYKKEGEPNTSAYSLLPLWVGPFCPAGNVIFHNEDLVRYIARFL